MKVVMGHLLSCLTIALSNAQESISSSLEPKIIGGYTFSLTTGSKLSVGSIRRNGTHYCGAIYIESIFVLTAASCIFEMLSISLGRPFNSFSVSLGGIVRRLHGTFGVKNVNTHKDYTFTNFAESRQISPYDIGLILLDRPKTPLRTVKKQSYHELPCHHSSNNYYVRGWGSATPVYDPNGIVEYEDLLKELKVKIESNAVCSVKLGGTEIHGNLMCISGENEYQNVGMGDVGDPVLVNRTEVMIAVVIHVFNDNPSLPAVCIRITEPIIDYIKEAQNQLESSLRV